MAVEKNPFEKLEKINTDVKEMTQGLPGVDVNVDPEQEEDVAVDVDPATGEVSVDLNENAGTVLASIKDFKENNVVYFPDSPITEITFLSFFSGFSNRFKANLILLRPKFTDLLKSL